MKHYLGILLIIDTSPHIHDPNVKWEMDPNIIPMNIEIWKKYMNIDEDILGLFIQLNPNLKEDEYILNLDSHTLQVQGKHCISPGSTILTLKSMSSLKNHFTFDYIIRSTSSCFWVIPRLKKMLLEAPRTKLYKGTLSYSNIRDGQFVSGSGMIFSKDIVDILITLKNELIQHSIDTLIPDDLLLANVLRGINIPFTDMEIGKFSYDRPFAPHEIDHIIKITDVDHICQYRVKTGITIEDRLENDTLVLNKLYDYYYGNK